MKLKYNYFFAFLLFFTSYGFAKDSSIDGNEGSGISFYVLRVVYMQSDKNGASFKIYNKSDNVYLLQSKVINIIPETGAADIDGVSKKDVPFIVTPPLTRLEANSELTLRIRRNNNSVPEDKESVYYISMRAIPAQENKKKNDVSMVVVNNLKLFYRPDGLKKRGVEEIADKLQFSIHNNQLIVKNPTKYQAIFSALRVGDYVFDKPALRRMVPAEGTQTYLLPKIQQGEVTWQLIDEDGWNTKAVSQAL